MKIVYLSNSLVPSRSANSVHVMKMCQAFSDNGHEVVLVAKKNNKILTDSFEYYGMKPSFLIRHIPYSTIKVLGVMLYSWKAAREARRLKPDFIFGRNLYSLLLTSRLKIPVSYDSHAFPSNLIRRMAEIALLKKKNFTQLMVISDALKAIYLDAFKFLDAKKIVVAHCAADVPIPDHNEPIKLHVHEHDFNVGYVGHLYSGRGIDLIIAVAKNMPGVGFHIIGGYDQDVKKWKDQTAQFQNIYFYGFLKNSLLPNIYPQLDVLMAPYQKSVYGGKGIRDASRWMSPMKIFEYMSHKKAIISSRLPTIQEVLTDGSNSILCDPGNEKEWQTAIQKLHEDTTFRTRIAEQAYQDFMRKYTWQIRARKALGE